MQLVSRQFPKHALNEIFHVYLVGDLHVGNIFLSEKELSNIVKRIAANDHNYVIFMGDLGEYITPSDRRWDAGVIAPWLKIDDIAECQRTYINDMLAPIRDKSLGMLWGNHEQKMRLFAHQHVHEHLCKDFNCNRYSDYNLGFSCYMLFKFHRTKTDMHMFTGAFTHGSGGAVTDASKLKKLHDFMDQHDADFYGYAHTHACKVDTRIELGVARSKKSLTGYRIRSRNKQGALTGCFFKSYEETNEASYGEQKNYRATPLGCAVIHLDPTQNTYSVESILL